MRDNSSDVLAGCVLAIAVFALVILCSGFLASVAWNIIMPDVFGLKEIDFVQGVALAFLASLFKATNTNVKG